MTKLECLEEELKEVQSMTNEEVMNRYNTDSKEEIIELIKQDIIIAKSKEEEILNKDTGMDYDSLCYSQGISRYC